MVSLKDATDARKYGGKASGLAKLFAATLPVPHGYACAWDEWPTLDALDKLELRRDVLYAVRSSAIGEDGQKTAFAGQYDTILDVPYQRIPHAAKRVRGGLHNVRASAYRRHRHVTDTPKMGLVIQAMVKDITHSAIVFTHNPLDMTDDVMIEWSSGRGDQLVGGQTTPVQVIVPRRTHGRSLGEPDLGKLMWYALRAERAIKAPADVEACYNGAWWLCQARPITTL